MKLILGCGKRNAYGENVIGIDKVNFGWNKVYDVGKDNFALSHNRMDEVICHNLLEHIPRENWIHLFNECHNILKKDGTMHIIAPDAGVDIDYAMQDITHVSLVVKGITKYLRGERPRNADYGLKEWKILKVGNLKDEPKCFEILMTPVK